MALVVCCFQAVDGPVAISGNNCSNTSHPRTVADRGGGARGPCPPPTLLRTTFFTPLTLNKSTYKRHISVVKLFTQELLFSFWINKCRSIKNQIFGIYEFTVLHTVKSRRMHVRASKTAELRGPLSRPQTPSCINACFARKTLLRDIGNYSRKISWPPLCRLDPLLTQYTTASGISVQLLLRCF